MTAPEAGAFEIELRSTGEVLTVPADRTALQVLQERLPGIDSNCLQGECGACVQTVLAGRPLHLDTVLSARAKAAGKRFIACVSRSAGDRLVLDL
jgi:xanthine dehydrogenase iron-sulfur cluster and FAD-binding subunit A